MASYLGRRKFLATLGGAAAAWPLAGRAQQTAMPVVGFFYSGTLTDVPHFVAAFRQGLKCSASSANRARARVSRCAP